MDSAKENTMMPSYGITLDSVTTDVGPIDTGGMRKVDTRHYNGYLLVPGLVYHMVLKIISYDVESDGVGVAEAYLTNGCVCCCF